MTILSIYTDTTGQVDVLPRRVKIITTDNLATITAAGYLAGANREGYIIKPTDVFDIVYSYSTASGVGTYGVFTVTISSNVPTLVQWANPGDILLPVVSGDVAIFNGTSGQIKDSGGALSAADPFFVMSPGAVTIGDVAKFNDVNGTVADAGFLASNVMLL